MARQRAPKATGLNLSRAWKIQAAIEHLFDTLETLVPPAPSLFYAMQAFEAYQRDFRRIEAIDAPKIDQPSAGLEPVTDRKA